MRRGPFFFFFFFFSLFKTTKICFGLPKWKFSTGKKHFTLGKKIRKNDLAPSKNFPVMPLVWFHSKLNYMKLLKQTEFCRESKFVKLKPHKCENLHSKKIKYFRLAKSSTSKSPPHLKFTGKKNTFEIIVSIRPSQMATSGSNPACRPFLLGSLSTLIYIETHREMVFIWR